MLVYAGIDEAGYGPMFGPLCVGASVFVLEEYNPDDGAPDLWSLLHTIVCKSRKDKHRRIAVNDSKKLKSGSKPADLFGLERGVFAFLDALHNRKPINDDSDFFKLVGSSVPDEPWFKNSTQVPVAVDAQELKINSNRLNRALENAKIKCDWLICDSVDVQMYNKRTSIESKAALNFSMAMNHVHTIMKRYPTQHPRVMVDRHGGRTNYRNDLQLCWPEAEIQILCEDSEMSRYRMQLGKSLATVTFASKSDEKHLPVALASMIAKYTRELKMIRLNRYFQNEIPELKPTAGYVKDGRRFLKEIEPFLADKGIKRELLVRSS
jgi:ribonuclease HII